MLAHPDNRTRNTESLEQIGQKYNFDRPSVRLLSLSIFYQLQLPLDEKRPASCAPPRVNDIGSFIPFPHHKHSYYLIKSLA
jgi:hypothetical protein